MARREDELVDPQLSTITVVIDHSQGISSPVYDLGGVDPWAAYAIMAAVADELWAMLPRASTDFLP